jgi:hypothetical protein
LSRLRSQASRFLIRQPDGNESAVKKAETPGAVLSKVLGIAAGKETEPGVWEVVEYEDVIYRVHRLPGETLDVRVEIVRP